MAPTKVLLVGATGETGGSIANGLLEAGNFVRIADLFGRCSLANGVVMITARRFTLSYAPHRSGSLLLSRCRTVV